MSEPTKAEIADLRRELRAIESNARWDKWPRNRAGKESGRLKDYEGRL